MQLITRNIYCLLITGKYFSYYLLELKSVTHAKQDSGGWIDLMHYYSKPGSDVDYHCCWSFLLNDSRILTKKHADNF